MKITMVFRQFWPAFGGIEEHIASVSRELARRHHDIGVLTTNLVNFKPKNLAWKERLNGITVSRLPAFSLRRMPICPPAFLTLLPESDVFHIHSIDLDLFTVPLMVRVAVSGKPFVVTPHFHPERFRRHNPFYREYVTRLASKILSRGAVIALTRSEKDYYEKLGIRNVFQIPNGVDLESHRIESRRLADFEKNSGYPTILFVGRTVRRKGPQILIKALPNLLKENPDIALYIVGAKTDYAAHLLELARHLKVQDNVRFHFDVSPKDLPYYYEISDLVALPSEYEAFPIVIVEAWAHKKPVLVFGAGGMREIVSQGGGVVLNSLKSEEWAEKMNDLLHDKARLVSLGREGFELVAKEYNWENVAKRVEKVYFGLLNSR